MKESIEKCKGTTYSVGFRYNQDKRQWVVRLLDAKGEQVGNSGVSPTEELLKTVIKRKTHEAYALTEKGV